MSNAFVFNLRQLLLRLRIPRLTSMAAVVVMVACAVTGVPAQTNQDPDTSNADSTRRQPLSPTGIDIEHDLMKSEPGEDTGSDTSERGDPKALHDESEPYRSALESTSATLGESVDGEASQHESIRVESDASPSHGESTEDSADERDQRLLPPDPRSSTASTSSGGGEGDSFLPPLLGEGSDWPIRLLGSLGMIIGILFFIRPVLKRLAGPLAQGRAHSGLIESLARYPFGRNQSLVLLKLNTRILLICQTPQGSSLLTEFTDPDDVSSILQCIEDDRGGSFSKQFDHLLNSSEREPRGIAGLFGFKQADARLSAVTSSDTASASADVVDLTQTSRGGFSLSAWLGKRAPAK